MAILNYTTTVAAEKTAAEIQTILVKAGAKRVLFEYDAKQQPCALIFELNDERYVLPCRTAAVHKILQKETHLKPYRRSLEQAQRVAWRILKDWIEAQLAIISTGMVNLDEVMLPYMLMRRPKGGDQTVYDNFREQRSARLLETK